MIFTKRKTIGVFLNKVFTAFDEALFRTLYREGRRLDYDIIVFMSAGYYLTKSDYDMQEKNIFSIAAVEKLDGVLIVPESYEEGEFRNLLYDMLRKRARCPVVAVRHDGEECDCVSTDERVAIRPLVRHLIEDHGLRRICFQTGFERHTEAAVRLEAFREEMAAHGLPVPEKAVCRGNMWLTCGEAAYSAFFSDPEDWPEAVICANDYMAVGLMRALTERNIRVPEDVIVVGFDSVPDIGLDVPSLTTIGVDFEGLVEKGMARLDALIRGGGEPEPAGRARIYQGGKLVLGESCGCGRRHKDYFRGVSQRAMDRLELLNDQDAVMNNMSIDLGACDDLEALHNVLLSSRVRDPIVRDHYLVLFGEPEDLMREDSGRACLVHAIRDQKDCGMPMVAFDRDGLLPPMVERAEEPQLLFFKLLHQQGHNFGYSVCQYAAGEMPSRTFVQTNALLSIALENIYRRRELLLLYEERRMSSITDMMTGLLNRRGLMERLEPQWRDLEGREAAFVCIDLDRLKHINDTYGHAAGDQAIRLVGRALEASLPPDALGARIGGDEFVAFLPDAGNGGAERAVGDFEATLARLNREELPEFAITASAGYVVKRLEAQDTIERCVQLSDGQMYRAKEARHARRTE